MSRSPEHNLFRQSAFIWGIVFVILLIFTISMLSQQYLGDQTWILYLWGAIVLVPLTIFMIYVNMVKGNYKLRAKGNPWIVKLLIILFGILGVMAFIISGNLEHPNDVQMMTYSPIIFLILQAIIWWYLPKPVKAVNPLEEKEDNIKLLVEKIEVLRKELILTTDTEKKFELGKKIETLEKEKEELRNS